MSRVALAIFVLVLVFFTAPAQSAIVVTVDKSAQRLTVEVDGAKPLSLARINRALGLQHAEWQLPAAAVGAEMVLAQIRLVADALFDLFQ